jgi:hypothetical protein
MHKGETTIPGARWLTGHEMMLRNIWSLGSVMTAPDATPTLREGDVLVDVYSVGIIEDVLQLNLRQGDELREFDRIVDLIVARTSASVAEFVKAISWICGVPPYISSSDIPVTLQEYV